MTFEKWYEENEPVLVAVPYTVCVARESYEAGERAGAATLRDERANTLFALRLLAGLRAALGDDGRRRQPELIEYARQLAADAARWRFLDAHWHSPVYGIPLHQWVAGQAQSRELSVVLDREIAHHGGGKVQP